MSVLATVLAAVEEAEPSKTAFYIVGGCLAVWAVLVGSIGITRFEVLDLMGSDRQVAAEVELDWGAGYSDQQTHLWTFGDDGKVVRFRHYTDTAKHIAAAGLS